METRYGAPVVADEKTTLEGMLDHYRELLLEICSNLTDEQLRRSMVPTGTSLLGIITPFLRGRGWFQENVGNEAYELPFDPDTDPDGDWRIDEDETAEEVFAMYRASVEKSRQVMADKSLDDLVEFRVGAAIAFAGSLPTCSKRPRATQAMPTSWRAYRRQNWHGLLRSKGAAADRTSGIGLSPYLRS